MLAPDLRRVAVDFLRPPPEMQLDMAVLTTYSLDLETMLALPLAVLAQAEESVDDLMENPLLLLEGLREAGDRIHVFCDSGGVALPRQHRALYGILENCLHPVRALHGGVFHPKVWCVRFKDEDGFTLMRVAVLSRNLTTDRSWDIALVSEVEPFPKQRPRATQDLSSLVGSLCDLSTQPLQQELRDNLDSFVDTLSRCLFPAPDRFDGAIQFHCLGLDNELGKLWAPRDNDRLLAMSPFATTRALKHIAKTSRGDCLLFSRADELDQIVNEKKDALEGWDNVEVLNDCLLNGDEDEGASAMPRGLHAKAIAVEHGHKVTWYVGSANLTTAALGGKNVELLAAITGKRGRQRGLHGEGIEFFLKAGFGRLCHPYVWSAPRPEDAAVMAARENLENSKRAIIGADARVSCQAGENNNWSLSLKMDVGIPEDVEVSVWPLSISESRSLKLSQAVSWTVPAACLTAFVGFRLQVSLKRVPDLCFSLKLPVVGLPENRTAQILRSLIDSRENFLCFLRALLGGIEGAIGEQSFTLQRSKSGDNGGQVLQSDALLEDLVRTASRDPERLESVGRLVDDLRESDDGRALIPAGFLALWDVISQALERGNSREET